MEIENGPDTKSVIAGELVNAAISYINILELAMATMASLGASERMLKGLRMDEAYRSYFASATNAEALWKAVELGKAQYEHLLRIAAEEYYGR
jgi:hypothetical protein